MNIFILKAMRALDNPELFTKDEMWENATDAFAVAAAAAYTAYYAADDATYAYTANYWLDRYFKETEENKQDYINEVERLK